MLVRKGDTKTKGGAAVTSVTDITVEGLRPQINGDPVTDGTVSIEGSPNVFIHFKEVVRVGDACSDTYVFATGSDKVHINHF